MNAPTGQTTGISYDTFLKRYQSGEITPLVLTPISRSGSFFVQSLLDQHPQVVSFAITDRLLQILFTDKATLKRTLNAQLKRDLGYCHNILGIRESGTVQQKLAEVDWVRELERLGCSFEPSEMVAALNYLLADRFSVNLERTRYLLLHEHLLTSRSPTHLERLESTFPNARLLGTVRDPRGCYVSFKKLDYFNGDWIYLEHHQIFGVGLYPHFQAMRYFSRTPLDASLLRLEDLQQFRHRAVDQLLSHFGLEPHPSAYQSTAFGYPWYGEFRHKKEKSGFIQSAAQARWLENLSPVLGLAIETAMEPEMTACHYPPHYLRGFWSRLAGKLLAPLLVWDDARRILSPGFYRYLIRHHRHRAVPVFVRWLPGILRNGLRAVKLAWVPRRLRLNRVAFLAPGHETRTERGHVA